MDNHCSQNISVSFAAQLASYFAGDGLFDTTIRSLELMENTSLVPTPLSEKINFSERGVGTRL